MITFHTVGGRLNDILPFGNSINTNRSYQNIGNTKIDNNGGIDEIEMQNFDKRVEYYTIFDEYCKSDKIKAPNYIENETYRKNFQKDVRTDLENLLEQYIKNNGSVEELENYLDEEMDTVLKKNVITYYGYEFMDNYNYEIKEALGKSDYVLSEDLDLQKKLEEILNDPYANIDNLQEKIEKVIKDYLGSAGIGKNYHLASQNNMNGNINNLQIAVLTQSIKASIQDKLQELEKYSTELNSAIEAYLKRLVKSNPNTTFENLKNLANGFKDSEEFTKLNNTIYLINNWSNPTVPDSTTMKPLTRAEREGQQGTLIPASLYTTDTIKPFTRRESEGQQSASHFVATDTLPSLDNTVYNLLRTTFGALAPIIIKYVEETAYQEILSEVKEWIKDRTPTPSKTDINNKMLELIKLRLDKIVEFNASSNYKELNTIYNGLLENLDSRTDLDNATKLDKHKDYAKDYLDSLYNNQNSDKRYLYREAIRSVIINPDYKEYIDGLSSRAAINGTIDNIRAKIKKLEETPETGTTSGATETGGTGESTEEETLKLTTDDLKSFAGVSTLISFDNANWKEIDSQDDFKNFLDAGNKQISKKIDVMITALKNTNKFDPTRLDKVAVCAKGYYSAAIDAIKDATDINANENNMSNYYQGSKTLDFSYTDMNGDNTSISTTYGEYVYGKESKVEDRMDDSDKIPGASSTGIMIGCSDGGNNTYTFKINLNAIVNKLVTFYNG